jgi:TRAP-type C4-dicarboxylate transport system permease small subunit
VAEAIRRLADRLIDLSALIGAAGLLVIMAAIMTDVIGRAAARPLYGGQDIVTMAMVLLVFGGMAACDRNGGHITVDILERHLPPGFNRAVDVLAALLGAAVFGLIVWAVLASARLSLMLNLQTNLLGLPKAWFQFALAAFAAITALGMALRAVELAVWRRDVRPSGGAH